VKPSNKPRAKLPRRHLLTGVVGAALAICGAAVAIARTGGYALPPGHRLAVLAPWQVVVVQHAARRIAAPDREADASIPTVDDLDIATFVDGWMGRMPARLRRDLGRFLVYLEHVAPIGVGLFARFTRLDPREQDRVLASLERSSSDLLRAGFDGLRSLVLMGYYRAPQTWRLIGYDGPLVGRPPSGWQ
jgi:hypothetical protein